MFAKLERKKSKILEILEKFLKFPCFFAKIDKEHLFYQLETFLFFSLFKILIAIKEGKNSLYKQATVHRDGETQISVSEA